jgi:membrane-bound serine protease (ClpP class)
LKVHRSFGGLVYSTRRSLRVLFFTLLCLAGLFGMAFGSALAQPAPGAIHVIYVEGIINPPVANYVERAVTQAIAQEAGLIVMSMNTPGGLDTSMREIIQIILSSPVPVAVYVAPSGARAASAGLFLLVAGHFAVMAPGTNTGSAHPVGLGGEVDEIMEAKVVEDAAASIRTLATERGRNAEWAERAVRESVSATEFEALEMNLIDAVAVNLDDLIAQLDGQTTTTTAGEITLDLSEPVIIESPMNFAENLLHVISSPDIAFILLSVGSIGILVELYNPGSFFPGITGVIALIFAFFSLGNLPTNWAGVALIVLAIALTVAELFVEGFGVLGIGALVAFVLGALILFRPFTTPSPVLPDLRVNPAVVALMSLTMAGFLFFVLTQLLKARKAPISSGFESFVGQVARVHSELNPRGLIWFEGTTWNAELTSGEGSVAVGKKVRITGVEGLTLFVEPLEEEAPETKNQ